MNNTLVSIIIPTYNRAHLIGETLESVIAQTYKNWECIVVDDGSTDYTDELMEFYCNKNKRIKYFNRPKYKSKGGNACRNFGLEISNGEYINWLDSDDLIESTKLEKQIDSLEDIEVDIAICRYGYIKPNNEYRFISKKKVYQNFNNGIELLKFFGLYKEYLPVHTYLMTKKLINKSGGWNESLIINQDGEFLSRVLSSCKRIKFVDSYAIYRRSKNNSVSSISDINKGYGLITSWKLIEFNLKFFEDCKSYILTGKLDVFNKLKDNYETLIINDLIFFKPVIPKGKFLFLNMKLKYKTFEKYFN